MAIEDEESPCKDSSIYHERQGIEKCYAGYARCLCY
jgi:hypothetical protein